jgi:hypothetical protein
LAYFDDAERDPMPLMFENISWEDIKKYFLEEQVRLFSLLFPKKD